MLVSPANTKLVWAPAAPLVALVLAAPAALEGRNKGHGTATSFSPDVEVEVAALDVLVAPGVPAVPGVPVSAEALREMTAKSIRPEAGLIRTSLMVPRVWPEVPFTWAPVN